MNVLAHLYLSGNNNEILLGNYLGDFVRAVHVNKLPKKIQEGVALHRKIDVFTDQHPINKEAKALLHPFFGKYGSVVLDIYWDYFLCLFWNNYSKDTLLGFEQNTLQVLEQNKTLIPEKGQRFLYYMKSQNVLSGYGDITKLEMVFNGMSRRATFESKMEQAADYLMEHEQQFEVYFNAFFPALLKLIENENPYFHFDK